MNTARTKVVDGMEYLLSSGSRFIIACPKCGEETFRDSLAREACWTCQNGQQKEAIRVDELESRWKPLWRSMGRLCRGDLGFEKLLAANLWWEGEIDLLYELAQPASIRRALQ